VNSPKFGYTIVHRSPSESREVASEATHAAWEASTCCGSSERSEGVNKQFR
jgi:hypothetical protein